MNKCSPERSSRSRYMFSSVGFLRGHGRLQRWPGISASHFVLRSHIDVSCIVLWRDKTPCTSSSESRLRLRSVRPFLGRRERRDTRREKSTREEEKSTREEERRMFGSR